MDGWIVSRSDFPTEPTMLMLFSLVVPAFAIDKKMRTEAFDAAIEFLRETHREHGWDWEE